MLSNYFKIALRTLRKNRAFAALNILGLGLSVACCTLIFMLVRHHLSIDQFHPHLERVAMIGTESRMERVEKEGNVPYPMGEALRQEYAFLEKTAMISGRGNSLITVSEPGQAPAKFMEESARAVAEPELFEIFDFPLSQGNLRDFHEPYTAMLTEQLARKYYGTTDVLGKTFKVNNRFDYRIVGVLKDFPDNTDIQQRLFISWATLKSDSNSVRMTRNWGGIHGGTLCFVRFREGRSVADLEAAFPSFREKYFHPEVREWHYHAIPFKTAHFDRDYGFGANQKQVWALALIGIFLLLTACVNFVNMATAQALNRSREVGVRKTMGSTRGQLFWQFMSETGVIVLAASVLGLGLAVTGLPFLNRLADTALAFRFTEDLSLYVFLAGLMTVVAFLAGAYPGVALSGFRPVESLKGGASEQRPSGFSMRRLLVASQFAISQALIIVAVVVTAQMEYSHKADLGFRRDAIVNLPLPAPEEAKKTSLKQQLSGIAGVEEVSLCMQPPASDNNWNTGIKLQGEAESRPWSVNIKFVDDNYLKTFDIKLVAGRNLYASDTTREFLVNETLVKKLGFATPQDILGKILDVDGRVFPVAGVLKDFHNRSFHSEIAPQVVTTELRSYDVLSVRLNLQNTRPVLAEAEKIWSGLYPEYVFESAFMDEQIAGFYQQESVMLQLVRLFAGIAVFIGCLGLYGLAAFMITRKTKEIGIRKTLGASLPTILWLFGKEYTRLILMAFVVAAPTATWLMQQWLKEYAYRISIGSGIFALSLLATFGIAIITVGFQSIRAALANPVKSLRSE